VTPAFCAIALDLNAQIARVRIFASKESADLPHRLMNRHPDNGKSRRSAQ